MQFFCTNGCGFPETINKESLKEISEILEGRSDELLRDRSVIDVYRKQINKLSQMSLEPCMRRKLLFLTLLLGTSVTAQDSDPSTLKPGQVLSEETVDLGNGYREVARSQVNPPGHWEGMGHFVFVYFKDQRLCQCDAKEIAISPDGRYVVFVGQEDGKLMLFDSAASVSSSVTDEYVGTPYSASWDLKNKRIVVHVKRWVVDKDGAGGHEQSSEIMIEIQAHPTTNNNNRVGPTQVFETK